MDDDRLKNGQHFGKDYFKELNNDTTVRNFRTVQLEGNREATRNLEFYSLNLFTSNVNAKP